MGAAICPNKNSKEWIVMLKHLKGDVKEAYRVFITHGYTLPTVKLTTAYKKDVGLNSSKYSVSQMKKIAKKVKFYNKVHGTSHFVKFTPFASGELHSAFIQWNYLPTNKEAQADRDKRRKMSDYTGIENLDLQEIKISR